MFLEFGEALLGPRLYLSGRAFGIIFEGFLINGGMDDLGAVESFFESFHRLEAVACRAHPQGHLSVDEWILVEK